MSKSFIRPVLAGAALAASSIVFGGAALAQQPVAAPGEPATVAERGAKAGQPGEHRHHRQFKAMRDGIVIPGIGPLPKRVVDELQLNEAQQKQLEAARAGQRELGNAMREAGKAQRAAVDKQLEGGKLDPRALLAEREAGKGAFQAGMQAQRDRWLALWDSLDAGQQAKVAEHIKAKQTHRAQRREARQAKTPA